MEFENLRMRCIVGALAPEEFSWLDCVADIVASGASHSPFFSERAGLPTTTSWPCGSQLLHLA